MRTTMNLDEELVEGLPGALCEIRKLAGFYAVHWRP
jgi:hypothetical protein